MEKVLKKLLFLIPILFIFIFSFPLIVFAESSSYYVKCNWNSCVDFGMYDSYYDPYEVSSLKYCTDDDLYIWFADGRAIQQTITLYDRVNKYYVNLAFIRDYGSDNNTIYSQINFTTDYNGMWRRFDTSQSIDDPRVFFVSLEDTSSFYTQLNFYSDYFKSLHIGDFYFYGYLTTQSSFTQYLKNNIDDFDLVNIKFGDFYVDGVKQDVVSVCPSEPEEPEEPEPEEPSQESNLNMVYVPNYQEGQCIEVIDKDTLRVFVNENTNSFIDYFVNSHYLSKEGEVESSYQKNCSNLKFTSIGYYRNDFPEILFLLGSISIFSIGFIFILFKRFRKR